MTGAPAPLRGRPRIGTDDRTNLSFTEHDSARLGLGAAAHIGNIDRGGGEVELKLDSLKSTTKVESRGIPA